MNGPLLRGRRCSVIVGDVSIRCLPDGLRATFSIEKTAARSANKGVITLANLAQQTRSRIETGKPRVVLEAGYEGSTGAVFIGNAYRVATKQVGADVITTLECADGGAEIAGQSGSWSYGPGASTEAIIRELVGSLGLTLSTGSRLTPRLPATRKGWAFAGGVAQALDSITKATGLTWSVQDQQVQILSADDPSDGSAAVVLSADTGLIGTPERVEVKEGATSSSRVQAVALLQPQLRPGRIVDLRSIAAPGLSGQYVVAKQKIAGDTHGPDWTTTLELTAR